jgi:hypothetical protein
VADEDRGTTRRSRSGAGLTSTGRFAVPDGGTVGNGTAGPGRGSGAGGSGNAGPDRGPRRILIVVYATFALAATARAVVQLTTQYDEAPLAYWLSLVSGIVYIAASVGLTSVRVWSLPVAWVACGVEMVGVLTVGAVSIAFSHLFGHDTVWSYFGDGYGFIPVVLPVFGLGWLWRHRHDPA